MKKIEDIYKAVEYIENNLKNDLSVERIANHIGYSLYYFSRIFSKTTGHSPYDYIMRRRLSIAAKKLINNEQKIIDIAFEYQFNSHETFTRAFTKMFNYLPSHIKTKKDLDKLVLKQAITQEYLDYINNIMVNIKTEIINEKALYFVGLVTNKKITNKLQNQITNKLKTVKENPENFIIYFNPINYRHMQPKLIAYKAPLPEDTPSIFLGKKIPAYKYIKFIISANYFNMEFIFQYLYQTRLKFTPITIDAPYAIEQVNIKTNKNNISKIIYIPLDYYTKNQK